MPLFFDFPDSLRRFKARQTGDMPPAGAPVPTPDLPAAPLPPQDSAMPVPARRIGQAGIALIKRFESCARKRPDGLFEAYPDPGTGAAPWTIGWGSTGRDVTPLTVWSQSQCDARLERDLARFAAEVDRVLGMAPTTPEQFDALVSFHYNTGAITRASLTRLHRTGQFSAAANEFGKWVNAGGRRLTGLVRRRDEERRLYLS